MAEQIRIPSVEAMTARELDESIGLLERTIQRRHMRKQMTVEVGELMQEMILEIGKRRRRAA